MRNRKRNDSPKSKLEVEEPRQTRGKGIIDAHPSERLRRSRKPETLQTFWRDRLQPWLDLANLLPFEPSGQDWRRPGDVDQTALSKSFVQVFVGRPQTNPLKALVPRITRSGTRAPKPNRELANLFETVLTVFERLQGMKWPSAETAESEPAWTEHFDSVPFNMTYFIEDTGDGRVSFKADLILKAFKEALEGVEISRVARCPICGRFYYAVRNNKGACDEHLARARVERGRNPELRRKYEDNRSFRKRLGIRKAVRPRQARELSALHEALKDEGSDEK